MDVQAELLSHRERSLGELTAELFKRKNGIFPACNLKGFSRRTVAYGSSLNCFVKFGLKTSSFQRFVTEPQTPVRSVFN